MNKNVLKEFKKFIDSKNTPSVIILRKRKRLGKEVYRIGNIPVYECYRATGTISYLINRKAAEIILKENTPIILKRMLGIHTPNQNLLNFLLLMKIYAVNGPFFMEK